MLVPVIGVDLVADDGVAHLLDAIGGRSLIVGVRLLIDRVGRPEIERLNAELGREEPLGQVQLQLELTVGNFADVRMREGVVADLMAFANVALQQVDVVLRLLADHHESGLHVVLLQHVENLRRPDRVGTVVEGQRKLVRMVAVLLDDVRPRQRLHVLVGDR